MVVVKDTNTKQREGHQQQHESLAIAAISAMAAIAAIAAISTLPRCSLTDASN